MTARIVFQVSFLSLIAASHRSEPAAILRRAHESHDDGVQIQSGGHRVAPGGSRKAHRRSSAVVDET